MFISTLRAAALVGTLLSPFAMAVEVQESNQFLIELSSGDTSKLATAVSRAGGSLTHVMPELGYATAVSEDPKFSKRLKSNKSVRSVTRDLIVQWTPANTDLQQVSFDGIDIIQQGHEVDPTTAFFGACQWANDQVDVQGAWGKGIFGNSSAKVAVLDSGVDPTHSDLVGRVDLNQSTSMLSVPTICDNFAPDMTSFQDFGFHGTFVSGIVAANGYGIAGVAPDTEIVAVKVLSCLGSGSFGDLIAGIAYAASLDDVSVINMSLGAYLPKNVPGGGPLVAALNKAVNHASALGKFVVSAAGNDGADLQHDGNWTSVPAESGNGIATWAGMVNGALAGYSNHGVNAATLGAGGGGVAPVDPLPGCLVPQSSQGTMISTCNTTSLTLPFACGPNSYVLANGTSFSAPMVSGVAALLDGVHGGSLGASELKDALKASADDIGKQGADNEFGHGRVNANNAVDY